MAGQSERQMVDQITRQRLRLEIQGAVQGVGFRPFVYRLATELGLVGWIVNDTQGVFIEVEGVSAVLWSFLERLQAEKPPLARIYTLQTAWLDPAGYGQFEIRKSAAQGAKTALVLPDIATCPECLAEVHDPADRRFGYPFTNCTNCGPRFSILQALPYDRPNTTMRRFALCPACQAEYDAPDNRRFHAQPNACPVCGPQLALWRLAHTSTAEVVATRAAALQGAVAALRGGQIVAVKGIGGFQLLVDAVSVAAVARLRARKHRPTKPFAVMVRNLEQASALCEVGPAAARLLGSPEAPIVLLRRRAGTPIAANIAPGNPTLGLLLPTTPLHHLLLGAFGCPVVATSGNLSDEPICIDEHEAVQRLGNVADIFLVHDRPIERHVDDSVAWIIQGAPQILRRARGYAPLPVPVAQPLPTILAVGAHLKNTVALSLRQQVFVSQHIGDLETPAALDAFDRVAADFLRLYEAQPVAIAHDLHPDYRSTQRAHDLAQRLTTHDAPCQLIPVQHHHAHLAACLAEHGLDSPEHPDAPDSQVLGVVWDGTGYGTDGTIWGGEFLLGNAAGFRRVAHLRPFTLPGGATAVREPRRAALGLLWELYGVDALERDDLVPVQTFSAKERRILARMLDQGLNTPRTTSAGRLFDGVAALAGLQQQTSFEGEAAMSLEYTLSAVDSTIRTLHHPAAQRTRAAYPLPLVRPDPRRQVPAGRAGPANPNQPASPAPLVLDWLPLIDALLVDLRRGREPSMLAASFLGALVDGVLSVARAVGVPRVALSGGCFQNRWLTEHTARRLERAGFTVLIHRQVPPNDGGISLGQVAVAARRLAAGDHCSR